MTDQLAIFAIVLHEHKAVLFARWQAGVSELPGAADLKGPALRDHIPEFIDEMIAAIGHRNEAVAGCKGAGSPPEHGVQRLAVGFDIKEVVIEYNVLRGAVHHVAEHAGITLTAQEWQIVHHIIDDAIAWAVDTFAREQALELQRRREEHFAFVAHDVRTPLSAIALTVELMADDLSPSAHESVDMFQALQRNVKRIDELIRRVLEEQKSVETTEGMRLIRRDMDFWPLVHQLLQDLRPVTEAARIMVSNKVPRHLVVNADAGLLARALQNLVSNAVKFAPGGKIEIGARETADGIECWVRDDGVGIAPERLDRIFDKLETDVDPTRAGFGLGLAIFRQIVEAHGGRTSVESHPGDGATFLFTIPRHVLD